MSEPAGAHFSTTPIPPPREDRYFISRTRRSSKIGMHHPKKDLQLYSSVGCFHLSRFQKIEVGDICARRSDGTLRTILNVFDSNDVKPS
jgi:hypothetical protein